MSLALAIVYAKLFARLAKYRATDPLRASSPDDQPAATDDAS